MATVIRIIPADTGSGGGGDGRIPITRGFTNLGDPDLINYLGTRGETVSFQNPALAGTIGVNAQTANYYAQVVQNTTAVRPHVICNQMGGADYITQGDFTSTQGRTEENIGRLILQFPTEIRPTDITLHNSFQAATNNRYLPLYKFIIRGIKSNGDRITLLYANGNPGDYWPAARPINQGETAEVRFVLTATDWIKSIEIIPVENGNPSNQNLGVPISQVKVYGELDTANLEYGKNFGVESALMAINPSLWLPFDGYLDGNRVLTAANASFVINKQDSAFNDQNNTNHLMEWQDHELGRCCSYVKDGLYWSLTGNLSTVGGNGYSLGFWLKTFKNPAYKQTFFTISSGSSSGTTSSFKHYLVASVNRAGNFQCELDDASDPVFNSGNWQAKYDRDTGQIGDDGQWHWFAITVPPSGTARIYWDGVEVDNFSYGVMPTAAPRLRPGWGHIGNGAETVNERCRGMWKHFWYDNNRIWTPAEVLSVWTGFS